MCKGIKFWQKNEIILMGFKAGWWGCFLHVVSSHTAAFYFLLISSDIRIRQQSKLVAGEATLCTAHNSSNRNVSLATVVIISVTYEAFSHGQETMVGDLKMILNKLLYYRKRLKLIESGAAVKSNTMTLCHKPNNHEVGTCCTWAHTYASRKHGAAYGERLDLYSEFHLCSCLWMSRR